MYYITQDIEKQFKFIRTYTRSDVPSARGPNVHVPNVHVPNVTICFVQHFLRLER